MLASRMEYLKNEIISFTELIEKMLSDSIFGLLEKDTEVLKRVLEEYEPSANKREIKIDEHCAEIIAQYQPRASYLRTILMIYKMGNDLERIGDHVVNICQSSLYLIDQPDLKPLIDIPKMSEITIGMIKDSIRSFIKSDTDIPYEVCRTDAKVNELRDQIYRELITYMVSDPTSIERALHLMRISRNYERIADLATNIAEDTIFMVEGTTIKHQKK